MAALIAIVAAATKVAFVRTPRRGAVHLVVVDLDGMGRRRLDRFARRRPHVGEVALNPLVP